MNYYIEKCLMYCFYCMRTRNLQYNFNDNNIEIKSNNSVLNFMYNKEENKVDDGFVIIEKYNL